MYVNRSFLDNALSSSRLRDSNYAITSECSSTVRVQGNPHPQKSVPEAVSEYKVLPTLIGVTQHRLHVLWSTPLSSEDWRAIRGWRNGKVLI